MDEIDTPERHFSLQINSKIIRRVAAEMEAQIQTAKNSFCCPRSCPKIPQHPFMKRSSPAKHPVTSWAAGPWWVARWTRHPRAETTLHTFSPGLEGAEEHGWSRSCATNARGRGGHRRFVLYMTDTDWNDVYLRTSRTRRELYLTQTTPFFVQNPQHFRNSGCTSQSWW